MMSSVALVPLMAIPGLGSFCGGTVRKKNVGDIELAAPLDIALLDDDRDMPLYRRPMRRPFYFESARMIRIPLEIFERPAVEILESITRVWTHNTERTPVIGSSENSDF